ncbi:gluconokinase [Actinoplanes subglobosus]|uniref:Gluconokinase n=1 Tax=Actinoplanes subglobosus TaxID=1547892 RepID=A0ABV8JAF9_9ACTN
MPEAIVVMGVSGCGKSTVGAQLAAAIPGAIFMDADDLHPAANKARMASGVPLTDDDREPWLRACATWLAAEIAGGAQAGGRPAVLACSALRRRYRDVLRAGAPDLRFVHLHADADLLARRLDGRRGHFMPATLLASQLQTLEGLQPDEAGFTVDIDAEPQQVIRRVLAGLSAGQPVAGDEPAFRGGGQRLL